MNRIVDSVVRCAILAVLCLLMFPGNASAFGRWRNRGTSASAAMEFVETAESTEKLYVNGTLSLQELAQQRADAMAKHERMTHGIHAIANVHSYAVAGVAEGIGCGNAKDPKQVATCICGSRVVADAFCRAASGVIYRVRFFRN